MPTLIQHIDAIARQKQRDVLMVTFTPAAQEGEPDDPASWRTFDWKALPARQRVLDVLASHGVAWQCCGHFADVGTMARYAGQIHIDLAYEPGNPRCREVLDFFEHHDGSMKDPCITLWLMTLELAMRNAHHDEPGFWERWAERF